MKYEFTYPEGKKKALTFSYDDGQIYDRRLIEIFNKYLMKGTFHLNSGILDKNGFVSKEEINSLYKDHEVACHGVEHKHLIQLPKELLISELWDDRKELETITNRIITGMSYAFGEYSQEVITVLKSMGIRYARTIDVTKSFQVPSNFLKWRPTCHHNGPMMSLAEQFLNTPQYMSMPLFSIWGHSYEFERDDNWSLIEDFCKKVGCQWDVWYCTNSEACEYLTAVHSVVSSADGSRFWNPSGCTVYLEIQGELITIKPGEVFEKSKWGIAPIVSAFGAI
jgi:peptidoglycan-N-acetylglucosamine deacetylase